MAHGGKRKGAGRKSKANEQALIEKLSPLEDKAFKALNNAIQDEQSWAVKMYFEYMYGKPKERVLNENINYDTKELTADEIKLLAEQIQSEY